MEFKINKARFDQRLAELAKIGARQDGGVSRLALTDEDKAARDLVVGWMKELNLQVHIDQVGNLIGILPGKTAEEPVVMGSHIDTVPAGGRFDGAAGVLAGLEVLETIQEQKIQTRRPIAVIAFTNEEGVRYRTDMIGSRAFCGFLSPKQAYAARGTDGSNFGEELKRIGYAGEFLCGSLHPHAYVEYHIEQGPVLDQQQITVGVVTGITGISWQEVTIEGQANHAGTTPTAMRHDAGLAAARVIVYLRELANSLGENQRATCGTIAFLPNAINVIPAKAVFSVDLRNSDESVLMEAELRLGDFLKRVEGEDGVSINTVQLARIQPEACHPDIITAITQSAQDFDYRHRVMMSGAVHDALIMARYCPTGMIFVPSKNGISHSPAEYTSLDDLEAGANVLCHTVLNLSKR